MNSGLPMKKPCNVIPIITRLPTAFTAKTLSKAVGPKATLQRHITEDNPQINRLNSNMLVSF